MQPGDLIADRFEVVSLASSGGMGTVYCVLDRHSGVRAALKIVQVVSTQHAELFAHEADTLSELSHPGIVRYVDHGRTPSGDLYLAMEWLEGEDLAERLAMAPLTVDECITLGVRVADAMAAAHACGVLHRDIKPSNLFLREREVDKVKLLDFGVARSRQATRPVTLTGVIVGTPGYIAPEQALGAKDLDARADVFSFGCVLFECLTGRPAFEGEHMMVLLAKLLGPAPAMRVRSLRADVPEALDGLIARMLSKDPNDRPAGGAEVMAAFSALRPKARLVLAFEDDTLPGVGPASGAVRVPRDDDAQPGHAPADSSASFPPEPLEDAPPSVGPLPTVLGEPTPFVGREREIAALEAAFDACVTRRSPAAVLVTGAAGSGKSRLASELVRRLSARAAPPRVLLAHGDPVGEGSPFRMLAELLHGGLGLDVPGAGPARKRSVQRQLRARAGRHLPPEDAERVAEFLGEIAGVPPPPRPSVALRAARQDARLMGDQMRRAWEDWIAAESAVQPLVLVLEDLHWGDAPTVAFLDRLLGNVHDRAILVLALAEPHVHARFPALWAGRATSEMPLGRLSADACEAVVRKVLAHGAPASAALPRARTQRGEGLEPEALPRARTQRGEWLEPEALRAIVDGSGGNPQRLEEMLRAAMLGEGDVRDGDVRVRIDVLPDEARRRLSAASLFGLRFSHDGVSAVLRDATDTVQLAAWVGSRQWMLELARVELIAARGPSPIAKEHVFRHELVRAAAYAAASDEERTVGHRRAAEWLERTGDPDPAVMVEHLERAGEGVRAAGFCGHAAERSLEAHDYARVITWVARGVRCGAEGELLGTLKLFETEAHKWLGANAEALATATEAMHLLPRESPPWYSAAAEVALACGNLGQHERLLAIYAELGAIDASGERGPALAIAESRVALQLIYAGRHDLAEALLRPIEASLGDVAERDPEVIASVRRVRAFRAMFVGDAGLAVREFEGAAEAFERMGDLRNACVQRVNIGYATIELGAYGHAERELRGALSAAGRLGLEGLVTFAQHNLGLALARQGQLYEARKVETEALEAYVRQGVRRLEGGSRIYLAMILALGGDLAGAEQQARAAVEVLRQHPPSRAQALATLARTLVLLGRAREGLAPATEAMELLESLGGIEEGESLVRLEHAVALDLSGQPFAARQAIARAKARLMDRANRIQDAAFRASFLAQVPENSRTLTLARAWVGAGDAEEPFGERG